MDHHIEEFYRKFSDETPSGNFHEVYALHDSSELFWEEVVEKVPRLPRGWFELAKLNVKDRVEFMRDFWLSKFPSLPELSRFLMVFFESVDEIGVFISQKKWDDPFEAQVVYSIRNSNGFFRGAPPASEKSLLQLQKQFPEYRLPQDYLAFLQIHDGFWKSTDCTGLTRSAALYDEYLKFQVLLATKLPLMTSKGSLVNPQSLIPFYESFGRRSYQCFWGEWYSEQEMGNIYYSVEQETIAHVPNRIPSPEVLAFPTFVDWLIFYLESVI